MNRAKEECSFGVIMNTNEFRQILTTRARRVFSDDLKLRRHVASILADVAARGDQAVLEASRALDGVSLAKEEIPIEVPLLHVLRELTEAGLVEAIEDAARAIKDYHEMERAHSRGTWLKDDLSGARVGKIILPLERVGIYVPGGRAPYVSTVLMTAIPAKVAGVKEIVMCTPPRAFRGRDDERTFDANDAPVSGALGPAPEILVAAAICGVDHMFRVGGPQAIAAMAYGTETIPRVDKIVGPGNRYVQEAKMSVYGVVDIDMPAGPSEVCILADDTADPSFVSHDLLSQLEHGPDSLAVLLSTSPDLLQRVRERLGGPKTQESISRAGDEEGKRAGSSGPWGVSGIEKVRGSEKGPDTTPCLEGSGEVLLVLIETMDEGVCLVNLLAPEHLEIMARNDSRLVQGIRNAGAIYVGSYTPTPLGDYAAGPSHVLPTQGKAGAFSALGVDTFRKAINVASFKRDTYEKRAVTAMRLAALEGMDAHEAALRVRLERTRFGGPTAPDVATGVISGSEVTADGDLGLDAMDIAQEGASEIRLVGLPGLSASRRFATVHRKTKETDVSVALDLDRKGQCTVNLGNGGAGGFFAHMLDTLGYYWGVSLTIEGTGDPREPLTGGHHLFEDVGIAVGRAFKEALSEGPAVCRFAHEVVPMDDAIAEVTIDISGRTYFSWNVKTPQTTVGGEEVEAIKEFFAAFARSAAITLHVQSTVGDCVHHIIEAVFKSFGRALGQAGRIMPDASCSAHSTKGLID
jgi:histidinol dehydrogenase